MSCRDVDGARGEGRGWGAGALCVVWAVLSGLVALAPLALAGCEARVSLGGRCVYDSECGGGSRCLYGRCRAECLTGADCGGGLECLAGVCAEPSEACSETEPCASPELACAGAICATRCTAEGTCAGEARCDDGFAIPVCVPERARDAGPRSDAPVADDAPPEDAGATDAPAADAYLAPGAIRDLCVSRYHACVARGAEGIVQCWGMGTTGELGGGAPLVEGTGVVSCTPFGAPPNLCSRELVTVQTEGGAPLRDVVALTCGERTTLARTAGGALYSWGLGSGGELGRSFPGVISGDPVAMPVTDRAGAPLTGVEDAAMGLYHGCARRSDGTTWCWGAFYRAPHGQLGTGATDPEALPGAILATELAGAIDVTAADMSTCIVAPSGAVACVGLNEAGAAGEPSAVTSSVRTARSVSGIGAGAFQLVSGPQFHCVLDGRTPSCWGAAGEGALGRGDVSTYGARCPDGVSACDETAEPVLGAVAFTEIASGPQASAVCGHTEAGQVHCWGGSPYGESGSAGRLLAPGGPVERADGGVLEAARLVRVGGHSACAVTMGDELYCWGANEALHLRTAAPDAATHAQAVRVPLD